MGVILRTGRGAVFTGTGFLRGVCLWEWEWEWDGNEKPLPCPGEPGRSG